MAVHSEPGAGSDLASLGTKAVRDGDQYIINGRKIWTSDAVHGDYIFALVRTDDTAPKHDGISLILINMDQPGVQVRPIRLISGNSPFCETLFDDAMASVTDIIGPLNEGGGQAAPTVRALYSCWNKYFRYSGAG